MRVVLNRVEHVRAGQTRAWLSSGPFVTSPTSREATMAGTRRTRHSARNTESARTFSEWLPYWHLELGTRDARPGTHRMYDQRLRAVVRFFGDVPPEP
jgi:hypothetical protein